ncbi:MAG: arsenate reductase (glutaredoxin) [Gammaproteobacteria bacterium]|nr:arsenate reductase (glutaredoxin) [Gammaproteobacteria bacterium]
MTDIRILHNPRCSKSRATKQILDDQQADYDVVDYLKNPPDKATLKEILAMLGMRPRELMRQSEAVYKEKNLADDSLDDEALIDAMIENPILIERPIVITNGKAVIGRPPEKVLDIL